MPVHDSATLAGDCGGVWTRPPSAPLRGFSIDTRSLRAGEVFVALRTGRRDGHEFLAAAASRGAAAAIVATERPEGPPAQLRVADPLEALQRLGRAHRARFSGPVVGVTGSAGKTSTKDLLAVLLGEPGEVHATAGNLNNHLGVPLTLLDLDPARHRFAVVEAGISGPGEMAVLADMIRPDLAIVTSVGPAHLDRLGTVEGVSVEKAALAAGSEPAGAVFFPADCLRHPAFRALAARAFVATPADAALPGPAEGARLVPYTCSFEGDLTAVTLTGPGAPGEFRFRRVTPAMAGNAVLAIAAALHLGIPAAAIRARLDLWRPAALRGEVRERDGRILYLDCYNANPASMLDALAGFLAVVGERRPRLFVVGCMEELGPGAEAWHRSTGARWTCGPGDVFIVLGSLAAAFAEGVRSVRPEAELILDPEPARAAALVRDFAGPVFLKGSRRHELETLLGGDFDPHRPAEAAVA